MSLAQWPGHHEVTPADGGPCTWHNECPAVRRPQLPRADDGQDGSADVSQIGRCQTMLNNCMVSFSTVDNYSSINIFLKYVHNKLNK